MAGPYPYPEPFPQQPFPPRANDPEPYPENVPPAYPGMLPPPVQYPKRRRWGLLAGGLFAIAVIASVVAAIAFADRGDNTNTAGGVLTDTTAKTTIQGYLDALSHGDNETVARNMLCGLFDDIKERRSDLALARLAGNAFRTQFSSAEVTSIDRIVAWSETQVQVLFTMRVAPAGGLTRGQSPPSQEEQGIVQLLIQPNQILVCSYLLRTTGQY